MPLDLDLSAEQDMLADMARVAPRIGIWTHYFDRKVLGRSLGFRKKFDAEPQYIVQGYFGEAEGQSSIVTPGAASTISIEERRINCQTFTVEITEEDKKRISKIYYAETVEPFLLRKDSVTTDPTGKNTLFETNETVVAMDMPYKVMNDIKTTSVIKTVRTKRVQS